MSMLTTFCQIPRRSRTRQLSDGPRLTTNTTVDTSQPVQLDHQKRLTDRRYDNSLERLAGPDHVVTPKRLNHAPGGRVQNRQLYLFELIHSNNAKSLISRRFNHIHMLHNIVGHSPVSSPRPHIHPPHYYPHERPPYYTMDSSDSKQSSVREQSSQSSPRDRRRDRVSDSASVSEFTPPRLKREEAFNDGRAQDTETVQHTRADSHEDLQTNPDTGTCTSFFLAFPTRSAGHVVSGEPPYRRIRPE